MSAFGATYRFPILSCADMICACSLKTTISWENLASCPGILLQLPHTISCKPSCPQEGSDARACITEICEMSCESQLVITHAYIDIKFWYIYFIGYLKTQYWGSTRWFQRLNLHQNFYLKFDFNFIAGLCDQVHVVFRTGGNVGVESWSHCLIAKASLLPRRTIYMYWTENITCLWFGEVCSCCILSLLPQFACKIFTTTYKYYFQTRYCKT